MWPVSPWPLTRLQLSQCLSLLSVCAVVVCLCTRPSNSSHLVQSTHPSDCMSSPVTHQCISLQYLKPGSLAARLFSHVLAFWLFSFLVFLTFTNWLSPELQALIPSHLRLIASNLYGQNLQTTTSWNYLHDCSRFPRRYLQLKVDF